MGWGLLPTLAWPAPNHLYNLLQKVDCSLIRDVGIAEI